MWWKLGQLCPDFFEGEADALREDNERNSPQDFPRIASLARAFSFRANQSTVFVKPESRGSHSAPSCDLADVQKICHGQ